MAIDMRKTPSYLKGLAETRARADGEVGRLQRLLDELGPKLAEAQRIQGLHKEISAWQAEAVTKRDACDTLIRSYDDRLDPVQIAPIRATKARYGKRGTLKKTISQVLQKVAPAEVTTTELCLTLMAELQIDFLTKIERKRWISNSLGSTLKDLLEEGLVERLHDPADHGCGAGRWRWKVAGCELAALSAAATEAGMGVSQAKRRGRPRKAEQADAPQPQ
jgi:hypothetical protein